MMLMANKIWMLTIILILEEVGIILIDLEIFALNLVYNCSQQYYLLYSDWD